MAGVATVVDGGRRGRMHEGVPHGGPLVRSMLARANALAGNAPAACAIELSGTLEVSRVGSMSAGAYPNTVDSESLRSTCPDSTSQSQRMSLVAPARRRYRSSPADAARALQLASGAGGVWPFDAADDESFDDPVTTCNRF
jgi:allophanate hydrolase subunit 2